MKHRKEEHYDNISDCIENKKGACRFNSECWYKHKVVITKDENQSEVDGIKTRDLIERLFKEWCTQKIKCNTSAKESTRKSKSESKRTYKSSKIYKMTNSE